jgi:hypothetical protein
MRSRRYAIGLFFSCVILLVLLGLWIRSYFHVQVRTIGIDLNSQAITGAMVTIAKGLRSDRVRIDLTLRGDGTGRGGSVIVPGDFVKVDDFPSPGVKTFELVSRDGLKWIPFQVTGRSSYWVEFKGDVLNTSARELDLNFTIATGGGRPKFPLALHFVDLERVDIIDLSPSPIDRNTWGILYSPLPPDVSGFEPVSFQMRDRIRGGEADFEVFIVGIAAGLLSSFAATILWDLVRDWEAVANTKTHEPPLIIK